MSTLLEQASLIMIPSGYKEDVVYSVIPETGAGDLSFTRASNGTRINSAGLVEDCPWNNFEYSEQFDNAIWAKDAGSTITANSTTAPNGTITADTLNASAGSVLNVSQLITTTAGVYTYSIYLKKNATNLMSTYIYLIGTGFVASGEVNFDNGTYTVTSGTGATGAIENLGNGWFKISLTQTLSAGVNSFGIINFSTTGTRTVYAWGAQLNIGSTAKPYFPTTDRLNVPRLTYQNGGGGCPSLLLEKQSTNLALWSEDFTQSVWSLVFLVRNATANTAISPDGTQNADTIADSITTAEFGAGQLITATANTPQTTSIFVKANGSNFAMLRFYGNDIQKYYCVVVNLSTGVITKTQAGSSTSSTSSSITNMGNGWYRITATATMNTTDYYLIVNLVPSATPTIGDFGNSSYTGTGSNSIYVWGAQFE
jgi:hypothetical protein